MTFDLIIQEANNLMIICCSTPHVQTGHLRKNVSSPQLSIGLSIT